MAEQDTSPDEEITPEGMAEEADQALRMLWRLAHGELRPLHDSGLELIDFLKDGLKQGLAREHVWFIAFSLFLMVRWRAGDEATVERLGELRKLADTFVSSAEKELEAEEP